MKLDEWGKLLISWANFLDPNENISKIEDLATSGLFPRLLKLLQLSEEPGNAEEYNRYMQEHYSSLDFSGQKHREVAVLQATAFLIYCSLHHPNNDLQQKMIELPHLIQCQLTDFLQEFVDVPKSSISRELIFSKISEMRNLSGLESSSVRTPPNFGTPVTYTSSPSTEEIMASKTNSSTKKTSRIKKLRRDIEMLTSLKIELTEELDSAKECISKLETDMKKKDVEISRLKSEIKRSEDVDHVCEKQQNNDFKLEKMKATVESLEQQKCELEDSLMSLKNEKEEIYEELKKSKNLIQKAEAQRKMSDDIRASLEDEIENLKNAIEQLTITNEEQSEYIAELTRSKDDSKCFSDSQSENVILPESLGQHVIDLQVRELKEELDNKETEISELKKNINGLNSIIEENMKSIDEHIKLTKSTELELEQKNNLIVCLEDSVSKLNNELKMSQDCYEKMITEFDIKINRIRDELNTSQETILDLKKEKEFLETNIASYVGKIKLYEEEINTLKYAAECRDEEMSSLRNNIRDLNAKLEDTVMSKEEEITIKNKQIKALEDTVNAWVDRNVELNTLLTNLTAEIEEKNLTIKNNQTDLRNLECQNLFLTNTLQEKDSIINSMQTSINSMSDEVSSLKHKESSLVSEMKSIKCHNLQLQTQISELNELLSTCTSEKNSLMKTVEDKELTIQQQITKLKDMKTDFEARKRKLESDLEQKEREYKEAEEDRCRLNIDLDDLKHKFLSLEIKMKEKEKEILDKCGSIEKLEKDLMKTEHELESSRSAVSELQKVVSQLLSEAEEHNREEFNLKNQMFTNVEIINDLKTKLNEAEHRQKHIREENLKERESLNSVIEELKSSLVKLNDDLLVNNEINDLLTKDLTERNETIKNLENSSKNLKSELVSLQEENQSLINDSLTRDMVIGELKNKIDSGLREIESIKIEKAELSNALELSKKELESEIIKTENLQTTLSEYVSKINTMAEELSSSDNIITTIKKEVDELKHLKNDIEDVKKSSQCEIKLLKDHIQHLEVTKVDVEKELKDTESQLQSMKQQMSELQKLKGSAEDSNLKLKKEFELLMENYNGLDKEMVYLKEQLNMLKHINEQLKAECEDKTGQVSDYSKKLEDLLTKSHSEIKKLEENYITEKSKLTRENNSLLTDFENLKDEKEKLNAALKHIEETHSGCENKITSAECFSKELEEKVVNLNLEVSKYKEKEEVLSKELVDKNTTVCNLNNEIECLKKLISTYEFEEGILNTKLQAKETEINKLESTIVDLNKQLKSSEEKFEEELETKLKKIHDLDATIGKLNTQYVQVSNEKESLLIEIENIKSLDCNLKSLETNYQLLKEEKAALEQESITKSQEISQLQLSIYSCEREIQSLKADNENQSKMLDLKIKELEDTKANLKTLQNEILEAKTNEKALMEQLITYNDMIIGTEQNVVLSETELQKARSELFLSKDDIHKKDEVIESIMKEKNCLKLDMEILSKKNEMVISQLESKNNENQELGNRLILAESEISKLTSKMTEQDQTIESLYNTLHSQNAELNEKNNEIDLLQKEVKTVIQQLNEERTNKFNQMQKLKVEKDTQEAKVMSDIDLNDRIEQVRSSYEKKVHALKSVMKKQFTEKLEDLTYALQNENTDLKEKFLKEQERCARLQSELWNASDKLLIAQEQNRTLLSNLQNKNVYEVVRPSEPLSPLSKARSLEVLSGRNRGIDNFARDISFNESGSSRRSSIRSLPRGMGRVFPAAEEDGEVFDNRYLADLKAGRCDVQYDPNRMSVLQYRNSLCPPHLKSSYPAETQFICTVKEDDIKAGASSSLTSSENDVRKTKVQGNEKSCPLTPHTGQGSYTLPREKQSNERFVLRETNSKRETLVKPPKPNTPSRLKALFSHKKDENSPWRKSFFRRT